ncbi:cytochrome c oxidase subunit II [Aliterella atlantica]|uniref:Cytochrome c oxidase subunit 2 n=1 Tax=Aliterella atlantica CENA595 TaxID=1618023 RepID=A0A0D8ZRA5_9CYAN|nr:cytochrome c oxidase subunit II [Aliterella atlantica]KJH71338.1 cytochrome C oxidase subunit II [Aliterella atlantica CENA595]
MKIPSSIWTLLIGIVLTLVSLWYGQNHNLLPTAASEEALLVDGLFNTMMTVSIGLFLLVEGILIYSAFKFRRPPGDDTDGPPVFGNVPLEILWTAIPAIVVLGISIYSFDVYNSIGGFSPHDMHSPVKEQAIKMPGAAIAATLSDSAIAQADATDLNQEKSNEAMQDPATAAVRNADQIPQKQNAPGLGIVSPTIGPSPDREGKPPEFVVNITGMQYAWIMTYPDTGVVSSELHVPIGREVLANISANDVIHAFWVPEFRLKQDAIPGRQSEIRFTPDRAGTYPLICAELCGPYHGAMNTKVIVESQQDFDNWVKEQQVASKDSLNEAIAFNPANLSPAEFLAPYTSEMGINSQLINQIHHH